MPDNSAPQAQETATERYDRQADEFYRETGLMAPGKDVPRAMGASDAAERSARWYAWLASKSAAAPQAGTTAPAKCIHCGLPLSSHARFARCVATGGQTQFAAASPPVARCAAKAANGVECGLVHGHKNEHWSVEGERHWPKKSASPPVAGMTQAHIEALENAIVSFGASWPHGGPYAENTASRLLEIESFLRSHLELEDKSDTDNAALIQEVERLRAENAKLSAGDSRLLDELERRLKSCGLYFQFYGPLEAMSGRIALVTGVDFKKWPVFATLREAAAASLASSAERTP